MSVFEDRQQAFENKFTHDEDVKFKIAARRAKLLGLWAAEQMGLQGGAAEAYAKSVVVADLEEAGFDDLRRKVEGDLQAKGLDVSNHRIEKKLQEFLEIARTQIMAGQ